MTDLGKWAFTNRKFVWFLVAVLLLGGMYEAYTMSKLEDPEIKVKTALVVAVRPGASSAEMELEVTDPLERAVRTLERVKSVQSWSRSDVAILQVELTPTTQDEEVGQCWDMLRHRVGDASRDLPEGTQVSVQDDFNLVYGMFYALTGEGYTLQQLSDYALILQRELSDVEGVGRVQLYGTYEEALYIMLHPARMVSLGVSPVEVLSTLQGQNKVCYAGYYDNGSNRIRVTVADRFRTVEQIGQMVIQGHEDDQIRLCDIASVEKRRNEPVRNQLAHNGHPAIGIAVAAASGTDVLEVGRAVEECLDVLSEERLPVGISCHDVFNQPERVTDALASFFTNLTESVFIVVVVLMFAMGIRSGLIIGFSLLTIVVGTFLMLGLSGGSMQRVSLASFVLAMGMLVDNAIVVIDGILTDLRRGCPRREAMTAVGRKTAIPLLGATLIAILAFLPIYLSPDTAGVYVRDLFLVLAVSLLLSWVLALIHVPLMADRWLQPAGPVGGSKSVYGGLVYRSLRYTLSFGLNHRWIVLCCAVLFVAMSFWGFRYVRQGFFPDMTYDQLYLEYKLPEGINYTRVEQDLREIEAYLKSRPEVTDITTSIGGTPVRYNLVRSIATPALSYGELIVSFTSSKALEEHFREIQDYLTMRYPDAYVKLKKYNIMYKKYPIELQVTGPDPAVIHAWSDSARLLMEQTPEVCLVTSDWDEKVPFIELDFNQAQARRVGIGREAMSVSVLAATDGIPIGTFYEGRRANTVYVQCSEPDGRAIENLDNVPVFPMFPDVGRLLDDELLLELKNGTLSKEKLVRQLTETVPLAALGDGTGIRWEWPVIPRCNGQRTQTLMCSPVNGMETEAARRILSQKVAQLDLPVGYTIRWGGEKEASDQTMHYLFAQVPLGFILIVAVLVFLFRSYRKPLLILCCIPLLAVGVVGAMLFSGKVFNFCAIVGVLGLAGMLVKNCIVLMDDLNSRTGSEGFTATTLIESSCSRLRPVVMASATTILGMIPLLSDDLFGSMAAVIMGGLLCSIIATLVFLPVLYAVFYRIPAADRQEEPVMNPE